jgi:hypothetical protein
LEIRYTELHDGTPENDLTDAAKIARLYLQLFVGRKCSDE